MTLPMEQPQDVVDQGSDQIISNEHGRDQRKERRRSRGESDGIPVLQPPPRRASSGTTTTLESLYKEEFPEAPAGRRSIKDPWNVTSLTPPDRSKVRRRKSLPSLPANVKTRDPQKRRSLPNTEVSTSQEIGRKMPSKRFSSRRFFFKSRDDDTMMTAQTEDTHHGNDPAQPTIIIQKEGYLWKKEYIQRWSRIKFVVDSDDLDYFNGGRRYFVLLSNGTLHIYKTFKDRRKHKIEKETKLLLMYPSLDERHTMTLVFKGGKEKEYRATSEKEMKKWLEASKRLES